jgi:predicted ester cyclase
MITSFAEKKGAERMSPEDDKAIVRRLWDELFNRQNLAVVEEVVSSDFIHQGPGTRVLRGSEFFDQIRSRILFLAFPDLRFTIDDLIAEGDKVVTRWTLRGTQRGEFMGLPPTGNPVSWSGIKITRVVEDKIVEDGVEQDTLGLMRQLAGTMPPGQSGG